VRQTAPKRPTNRTPTAMTEPQAPTVTYMFLVYDSRLCNRRRHVPDGTTATLYLRDQIGYVTYPDGTRHRVKYLHSLSVHRVIEVLGIQFEVPDYVDVLVEADCDCDICVGVGITPWPPADDEAPQAPTTPVAADDDDDQAPTTPVAPPPNDVAPPAPSRRRRPRPPPLSLTAENDPVFMGDTPPLGAPVPEEFGMPRFD
jgi:hypothetical protein